MAPSVFPSHGPRRAFPAIRLPRYFGTIVMSQNPKEPILVERVQTGVRMEKRLLKVLKGLAELKDMTLGDLLEGIVLHAFEGKAPFFSRDAEGDRKAAQHLWTHAEGRRQPSTQGASPMNALPFCIRDWICSRHGFHFPACAGIGRFCRASPHSHRIHFTVDAPFEQAAPLFGANEERKWAPDWNPQFVYPTPARDQQGMIFRVDHSHHSSVWVNTAFDLAAGHIQYAYVLNDAMATLIDIHLTRESAQKTGVSVVYERTALHARSQRACPALRKRRREGWQGMGGGDQRILCQAARNGVARKTMTLSGGETM